MLGDPRGPICDESSSLLYYSQRDCGANLVTWSPQGGNESVLGGGCALHSREPIELLLLWPGI